MYQQVKFYLFVTKIWNSACKAENLENRCPEAATKFMSPCLWEQPIAKQKLPNGLPPKVLSTTNSVRGFKLWPPTHAVETKQKKVPIHSKTYRFSKSPRHQGLSKQQEVGSNLVMKVKTIYCVFLGPSWCN